ncbi:glycosyltransferase family 39 protein, partial [Candidatus Woesearchaeota archaeon]|nr:glycosyltransferase family 39 protein [Candidatus Woesearchaeota archaeon]
MEEKHGEHQAVQHSEEIQEHKEAKTSWEQFIEKKSNLIALLVILAAFYLRFKYMDINAGLWWDEADYVGIAKKFWLGIPHEAASWRAYGSGIFLGFFYYIGAGEWAVRFVGVVLSTLGVYSAYLFGKHFYNKFVGISAAALMSTAWIHLFWTTRISMNVYATAIWAFAAYFFWKSYEDNKSNWYMVAAAFLSSFGIFVYESIGFIYI